jgi:hypothetical protein
VGQQFRACSSTAEPWAHAPTTGTWCGVTLLPGLPILSTSGVSFWIDGGPFIFLHSLSSTEGHDTRQFGLDCCQSVRSGSSRRSGLTEDALRQAGTRQCTDHGS